nr:MAG TPA: hypothetical protein [Caudoviricetes sp.]
MVGKNRSLSNWCSIISPIGTIYRLISLTYRNHHNLEE